MLSARTTEPTVWLVGVLDMSKPVVPPLTVMPCRVQPQSQLRKNGSLAVVEGHIPTGKLLATKEGTLVAIVKC